MPTDVIQADYERLEELARRFGEQAEAQSELHRRVAQAATALQNGGWVGEGAAAFTQEMQGEIFPTMQRLTESLEQAKSVTLQVSEVVRQAEEEAARLFGGEGEDTFMAKLTNSLSSVLESIKSKITLLDTINIPEGSLPTRPAPPSSPIRRRWVG